MFKYKVITLILFTVILISGEAYCQQVVKDQQVRTTFGKVVKVDVEGGVINVKIGNEIIAFNLSPEAVLKMSTHHISSLEIAQGDLVTIQYVKSSDKYNIISLVDHRSDS